MPRYKRTAEVAFEEPKPEPAHVETLQELRSMVEFAALAEFMYLFGEVVLRKVAADLDVEDLEAECLKPGPSERLAQVGLALLKLVSSHRGLTPEIFDEYTRRQYVAKAPQRNPYGEDEEPKKFDDFDVFTKIKVLYQLSVWTFGNVDRMRGLMGEDADHLNWRMEPLGWDKDDNEYYVLDDNRLYRRSDLPIPPPQPKPKPKKAPSKKSRGRATRSSKRIKLEETPEAEDEDEQNGAVQDDTVLTNGKDVTEQDEPGYGFTNKTWECVAVTLEDYQNFLATIFRSRDPNEKQLRLQIEENILPLMEERAEKMRQKEMKRMRELENLQKMASAKRSSRLAGKAEKEKQDREDREAEGRRQAELQMAFEEQEKQRRIEEGHESRRLTREQRLKEREVKRILHEEELARLEKEAERQESQESHSENDGSKRVSERQLKTQREQHKKELEKLAEDEDKWIFDCALCGMHGENLDDGTHSIACERCSVWQHSKCHGFSPKQSEREDFHFICGTCKRKEEDAKKPKIMPVKLGKTATSASPQVEKVGDRPTTIENPKDSGLPLHVQQQLDGVYVPQPAAPSPGPFGQLTSGPPLPPPGQVYGRQGHQYPPVKDFAARPPQQPWSGPGHPRPGSAGYSIPPPSANGLAPRHQEQHRKAHQNAMSVAGHSPQPRPHQPNGYYVPPQQPPNSQSPPQVLPYQVPPPQQYGSQDSPRRSSITQTQRSPPRQAERPPSGGHLMNGFQSPVKGRTSASPAQQHVQPFVSQTPRPPQGSPFTHSPSTSFPPPSQQHQQSQNSPIKSSPPPSRTLAPTDYQHQRQALHQTPQTLRPPSSNGNKSFETPQTAPSSQSTNGVAADGMSGPWPAGSKAIPEKHDTSPVPPPSSQAIGEKSIFPPTAALAPSPSQQVAGSTGTVPVKKSPEVL
ncbi:hypothetical protein K431DRAFT_265967 [Polychaeton citri CBS 116435]|uniref:Zinc finger PHD-type domain-containing protein n=1 Tax=Polychaeton citri CBS 116435 TaxID=1314669 RepID=A0A9P4QDD8_9PEZI|nr:hypothetical protein K431DRAFT_265967 [Polychaeton citri CBS 116435]